MTSDHPCPLCMGFHFIEASCPQCGLTSSQAIPPAGGKGAADIADAAPTQFAYLAIHDGLCTETSIGLPPADLPAFCRSAGADGGYVERVPLGVARQALYRPWPQFYAAAPTAAPTPAPDLVEAVWNAINDPRWRFTIECRGNWSCGDRVVTFPDGTAPVSFSGEGAADRAEAYAVRERPLRQARAAIQAVQEAQDWTVDASVLAGQILNYLGIGTDASLEPYADRRRDRVARMLTAWREAREPSYADGFAAGAEAMRNAAQARGHEVGFLSWEDLEALPLPPLSKGGKNNG